MFLESNINMHPPSDSLSGVYLTFSKLLECGAGRGVASFDALHDEGIDVEFQATYGEF